MKRLAKKIESTFSALNLSLKERGQLLPRSNKDGVKKLAELVPLYEKETRIPVYLKCQSSINDFIVMCQVWYAKNTSNVEPDTSE